MNSLQDHSVLKNQQTSSRSCHEYISKWLLYAMLLIDHAYQSPHFTRCIKQFDNYHRSIIQKYRVIIIDASMETYYSHTAGTNLQRHERLVDSEATGKSVRGRVRHPIFISEIFLFLFFLPPPLVEQI